LVLKKTILTVQGCNSRKADSTANPLNQFRCERVISRYSQSKSF
jgi:hypothetical protein